jgi:tetratricopeptide (TPR) repeat protein
VRRTCAAVWLLVAALACRDDPAEREYFAALELADVGAPLEEQLAHAERAIALAPERAPYYETRGGYRARLGDLEGASADYDRLIELRDRPYARFLRANLTAKRGDPARALADYDRAIEAQPWNLQFYRGRALARAAVGRSDDALADAERLVAEQPQWAPSWHARPVALLAIGRPQAALADIERALAMSPESAYFWSARAEAHERLGDVQSAARDRSLAAKTADEKAGCGYCLGPFD